MVAGVQIVDAVVSVNKPDNEHFDEVCVDLVRGGLAVSNGERITLMHSMQSAQKGELVANDCEAQVQ